jgi:hypothetical protein
LTQGRYKAQLVEGNEYLLKLSRYIHSNPVCGKKWTGVAWQERRDYLLGYRWSTYRSYVGLEARWSWVDYGPMQALVEELGVSYREYVESGLGSNDEEFQALYQQARLSVGSEVFAEQVREEHEQRSRSARRPEDVALRRVSAVRSTAEVLKTVASLFGISEEELRRRSRDSKARGAAAWALVRHAGLTQRGAAEVLGIGSGAAVSQQLTNWRLAVQNEERLSQIQTELQQRLASANF